MDVTFFFLHGLLLSLFVLGILRLQSSSAAVTFATFALFFANFFFQKRWIFLTLPVTTGSQYITSFMLLLFFLCERAGKERAIYVLGLIFFFTTVLLFNINLHLLYLPAPCDSMQWALRETFSGALFLYAPSLAVLFPLQLIGLHLWTRMRRAGISITTTALLLTSLLQLIDTAIFISVVDSISLKLVFGVYLSKILFLSIFLPLIIYFESYINVLLDRNE